MDHVLGILDSTYEYQTKVFCILSDHRVFRSKSPEMFNAVIARTGIKGTYVPFMIDMAHLGHALTSLRVLNIAGANITAPFKEQVLPHMDVLSEGANIIGAVNTIVCKNGQLKGYNTNAIGIMDALNAAGFDVPGKKALVIGTGGAARAVLFILNWLRADSVIVAGRNPDHTRRLAEHFRCTARTLTDLGDFPVAADIIINATSISAMDECAVLNETVGRIQISGCQLVFDLNYGLRDNLWMSLAESHQIPFMDGLSTLAYQARRTFQLWTGQDVSHAEFLRPLGAKR